MVFQRKRLAERISLVFSAPTITAIAVLSFAFLSPLQFGPLLNWLSGLVIGIFLIGLLPIIPIILEVKKGNIDINVSERTMRPKFLIQAIVLSFISGLIFFSLQAVDLMVLSFAYSAVTLSILIVSLYWKISIHAAGIAGPLTAIAYILGWPFILLFIILLPVGWARVELDAHNVKQFLAGTGLAVLITLMVYMFFSLFSISLGPL